MALTIKNSRDLTTTNGFKLKILCFAVPGFGKTTFASTSPNPGIAACETGLGQGLVSVADKNLDYIEISGYNDLEAFCSGAIFRDKETLVADSITEMERTFIKDYVIHEVARTQGDSDKRRLGVPELDDYGSMAEVTRRLMRKLIEQPKHIVVTALFAPYEPSVIDPKNPKNNRAEKLGGPDLPGQLRMGSTAMFDVVLRGVLRPILLDPKDAKSRVMKRYWITCGDDKNSGKSRLTKNGKAIFPPEVEFNLETGSGTFEHFYKMYLGAHSS